jgi:hypothetical protein
VWCRIQIIFQSLLHIRKLQPAHNLSITANEKKKYLLKGIFNGFITELFTATFLQNIVAEGSQQLSTRPVGDTFVIEDLKGFFKCLW